METCCETIQAVDCSLYDILQRITPVEFIDGVLIVSSPMSVTTSLTIDDITIEASNDVLELPEGTTVGGVALLSPHYVDDVYVLPSKTLINGFTILNTNYFYFYSTSSFSFLMTTGIFINNTYNSDTSITYAPNYPFLVPSTCVLTSLLFSMDVNAGGFSSITNAKATIYIMSSSNTVTNTGISTTIAACPISSRNFNSINFQYPVPSQSRIGVRVEYNGSASVAYTPFATLGYKFI